MDNNSKIPARGSPLSWPNLDQDGALDILPYSPKQGHNLPHNPNQLLPYNPNQAQTCPIIQAQVWKNCPYCGMAQSIKNKKCITCKRKIDLDY